jgi:pilus assembly protein CpaF
MEIEAPVPMDIDQRRDSRAIETIEMLKNALGDVWLELEGDDTQEVMVNGPDIVFCERAGKVLVVNTRISNTQILNAVQLIARADGSRRDAKQNSSDALVNARLPGYRISATLSPVSVHGNSIAVRKHNPKILSLQDYVLSGAMTQEVADYLRQAIRTHKNIIVAGGTSSGKTTLLNAMIAEIDPVERILTVEDPHELKVANPNWVAFEANEQLGYSIRDLVKQALRYRPDRILVGEVRGAEAFDLMQAANTGHDGTFATLHANSAADALDRLETMVLTAETGWPFVAVQKNIGKTFNVVLHMDRIEGVRRLSELIEIQGYDVLKQEYKLKTIFSAKEQQ